jgi:YidC/Oxa1 family membrane protein insertase
MMELYRERGVNPFGAIGLLLVQLPIFIALFRVIQIMTSQRDQIASFTYNFLEHLGPIHQIIADPQHQFNESLLGIVNLTHHAIGPNGINIALILLAVLAAGLQFWQSKQITPAPTEKKRLRDILSASATGEKVDQSEISALMSQRMIMLFPLITLFVALYLPGALVLYYAASSGVAVIQQHLVLSRDVDEMENLADKKSTAKKRAAIAQEATVLTPKSKPKGKKRRK